MGTMTILGVGAALAFGVGSLLANRRVQAGARYVAAHRAHGELSLDHLPDHLAELGREGRLIRVALEGVQRQLSAAARAHGPDETSPPGLLLAGLQVQLGEWLCAWDRLDAHDRDTLRQLGADVEGIKGVLREEVGRGHDRDDAMVLGAGLLVRAHEGAGTRSLTGRLPGWLARSRQRDASRQDRHLARVLHCLVEIEVAMQRTPRAYR
ncbi:MAG: hypothetical protein ACPHRO_00520 [Nannocystaceae bacterium]